VQSSGAEEAGVAQVEERLGRERERERVESDWEGVGQIEVGVRVRRELGGKGGEGVQLRREQGEGY
jgi:hypothetical protein